MSTEFLVLIFWTQDNEFPIRIRQHLFHVQHPTIWYIRVTEDTMERFLSSIKLVSIQASTPIVPCKLAYIVYIDFTFMNCLE